MLFDWIWSLFHRKKFMPVIITMVKSIFWKNDHVINSLSSIYVYIHESFLLMCIVVNINIHSCSKYWDSGTMSAQAYMRHLHTLCPYLRGLGWGEPLWNIVFCTSYDYYTHELIELWYKIYIGSNQLKL